VESDTSADVPIWARTAAVNGVVLARDSVSLNFKLLCSQQCARPASYSTGAATELALAKGDAWAARRRGCRHHELKPSEHGLPDSRSCQGGGDCGRR
jgi:hypothetical protein